MYIDKLYTKLYSERDWNALSQLVSEIKSFARKDYEGLGLVGRGVQRLLRGIDAFRVKNERKKGFKKSAQSILDKAKDNSDTRQKQMNVFRSTQLRRDKDFVDKLKKDKGIDLSKVLSPLSKIKSAGKELLNIPEGIKSPNHIVKDALTMNELQNKNYDQDMKFNNGINEFLMNRVKEDAANRVNEFASDLKDKIESVPDKLQNRWNKFISRFKK